MEDLENILQAVAKEDRKLKRDATQQRRFIVVEGLYKNTGEYCPLPAILALKEKYFYRLILDETLSFGTTGHSGRGITEHFQLKPSDIEVLTFTLDTVLASVGGVCIGRREIIDHQRLSGAGYCFSASTAPFLSAAAIAALKKLDTNVQLLQSLDENSRALHKQLREIPQTRLLSQAPSPVMHLVLNSDRSFDEDRVIIQSIVNDCIKNGVGVVSSKFAISRENKPSIMICANAQLDNGKISKIVHAIAVAAKKYAH
jgi:serine palmitoyltransferase